MLVNAAGPVLAQGSSSRHRPRWSFLGIPQAFKAVREGAINKSGNHPKLEKKPPLKKIADAENLKSENPAIKKAAEIKKEEDLKWQKIKAIKYLTTIGCGCYNRDGSITDALMKAADDCTEEVRYATILAITGAAGGEMCENCKMRSCCSEELSNKLYEIAYERDDEGCFLEPSERVRLAAAEALRTCCPGRGDDFFFEGAPVPQITPPAYEGETPRVLPPGSERPSDAPPSVPPREPTPALPLPPVPTTSSMRPISELGPQRQEMTRQERPARRRFPCRQRRGSFRPAAPAAVPAAARQHSPRPRSRDRVVGRELAERRASDGRRGRRKYAGEIVELGRQSSSHGRKLLPFAPSTPHWSVGSKAPTVFISQPIAPARPIDSSRATTPAGKAETAPRLPPNCGKPVPSHRCRCKPRPRRPKISLDRAGVGHATTPADRRAPQPAASRSADPKPAEQQQAANSHSSVPPANSFRSACRPLRLTPLPSRLPRPNGAQGSGVNCQVKISSAERSGRCGARRRRDGRVRFERKCAARFNHPHLSRVRLCR
jgi:hypothetical protein